ncbi:MAG: hypothetical protein KAR23_04235 [Candidatus Aenigmarchaeota archaeon]|nr:hypothetical protein [Candidatus Aenigmarchaeota archaeon]
MKIYISSSLFGIFATDENGTYLNSVIIRKDHNKHFLESRSEQISEKEAELVKKLGKKGDLIFETKKQVTPTIFQILLVNLSGTI